MKGEESRDKTDLDYELTGGGTGLLSRRKREKDEWVYPNWGSEGDP